MSNENQSAYDVVLADLMARRDQLDAAIAAIQVARDGGASAASAASGSSAASQPKIQADDFFGMTVLEASKKYLAMMKRPQNSQTITDALQSGGYLFSAGNPVATVASVLNRDDGKGGDIVRVGKSMFGLAAWYPNRPKRKKNGVETGETEEPENEEQDTDASDMK